MQKHCSLFFDSSYNIRLLNAYENESILSSNFKRGFSNSKDVDFESSAIIVHNAKLWLSRNNIIEAYRRPKTAWSKEVV